MSFILFNKHYINWTTHALNFQTLSFWVGRMEKAVAFRQLVDTLSINEFETFISQLINKNGVEWIKSALYNQFISDFNGKPELIQSNHDHHDHRSYNDQANKMNTTEHVDNAIQIIQNITHDSTTSSSLISAESFVHYTCNNTNKSAKKLKIIFANKSNNIMDIKNQIDYIFGDKWCWMLTTQLIIEWKGIYCNQLQNHLVEVLSKSAFIPKLTKLKSIQFNGWTNIDYQYKIFDKLLSLLPDSAYIKLDDEYMFNHYRQRSLSSIVESDLSTSVSDTNNLLFWTEMLCL